MTNIKQKKFIIFIVALVSVILSIRLYKTFNDVKFSISRNAYKDTLTNIENYSDEDENIKSISVNTDFHDSGSEDYHNKVDSINIKVNISNNVENMTDKEKCSLLYLYQTDIENLIQTAKEQSGYKKFIQDHELSNGNIKYKGKEIYVYDSINIYFISTQYEYTFYLNHFYVTKKNIGGSTEYSYQFKNGTLTYFNDIETEKKQNAPNLPHLGMREEYLQYTSLGKANSIEKCIGFDSLAERARSKTYEWEKTANHGWYKVTVRYRLHHSHNVDDYEDLPASNGYVSNITYVDKNGSIKTENYANTH